MPKNIYIIGHKSPDLDSVAAVISYADLKNKLNNTDIYKSAIPGEINKETKYILDKFAFAKPEILETAEDKKFILVDHNEFAQSLDGMDGAEIIEVLDHHKVEFKYSDPIPFKVEAWGSASTIVASEYLKNNIEIDKNMAGLMLSAILVDTVISKSPTCTAKDVEIIEKLAELAEINDWKEFGMEIFKVRSSISDLSAMEIIKSDFKDFNVKVGKIGIGQVETVDLAEFAGREDELLKELNKLRESDDYHSVILFITDIIKEGSKFLVSTYDQEQVELALGEKLKNNRVYIEGIISRKKQVAPKFSEVFDK